MNDLTMFERHTQLHFQTEIGMYYCGKRINTPNHEYGPLIKDHYLFVLVNKGNADLFSDKKITFGEHDLLIMFPNQKVHYKALDKWSISWLGLYGKTVSDYIDILNISPLNPIMHIPLYSELKTVMDNVYELSRETTFSAQASIIGLIYEFFAVLLKCSGHSFKTDLVTSALKIIDYNYCSIITIEQIAEYLSVDPAYFSRRFAQKIGVSPKRYIIKKRIERAKELLCSTDAGVFEIANSVGYEDQFYFYKIFKKYTNLSPSEYRKKNAHL
jgi:YesN/AraC family two-component response regulator